MKKEKLLLIIAVIWLAIALFLAGFAFCDTICKPGAKCTRDYLNYFIVLGIPSWIAFIYLIINKLTKKKK